MQKVVEFRRRLRASARFKSLLEPHFGVLYSAARRLTASPADAQDLVQDVCIKAWRHRGELGAMEYPRAWLLRTLYNRFIDDQRRLGRSPQGHATPTEAEDGVELVGPERMEPEHESERIMNLEALNEAMDRLSREQRTLLWMHDIDGLSLAEIGAVTGLANGTIKSKLYRARVKLGRLLWRVNPESSATTRTGG